MRESNITVRQYLITLACICCLSQYGLGQAPESLSGLGLCSDGVSRTKVDRDTALRLLRKGENEQSPSYWQPDYNPFREKEHRFGDIVLPLITNGVRGYGFTDIETEISITEAPGRVLVYATSFGPKLQQRVIPIKLDYYDEKGRVINSVRVEELNPYKQISPIDTIYPDFADEYNLYSREDCDYSRPPATRDRLIYTSIQTSHSGFHQVVFTLFRLSDKSEVIGLDETIILLDRQGRQYYKYNWDKKIRHSAISSDGTKWLFQNQDDGGVISKCKCVTRLIDIAKGKVLFDLQDHCEVYMSGATDSYREDLFCISRDPVSSSDKIRHDSISNIYFDLRNSILIEQRIESKSLLKRFADNPQGNLYSINLLLFPFNAFKL